MLLTDSDVLYKICFLFQEFDIDPNSDSDQVDELLALCVKQATQATEGAEKNAT